MYTKARLDQTPLEAATWTKEESAAAASIWRASVEADPNNELWGRMTRRRLEGEAIRDAMLAVSGALDRWEQQGLTGDPWPFMAMCSVSRLQQILGRALDSELKRFRIGRTG